MPTVVDAVALVRVIIYDDPHPQPITLGCPIPGDSNCDGYLTVGAHWPLEPGARGAHARETQSDRLIHGRVDHPDC